MRYFREVETLAADYNVGSATWALTYLAIGDQEKSLQWLTRAAENRMPDEGFSVMWLIRRNLLADPILEQPEFVDVRSRLGFDAGKCPLLTDVVEKLLGCRDRFSLIHFF